MSTTKKIVLVYPDALTRQAHPLADALRQAGAEVEQHFLGNDYGDLLDVLATDAIPVVLKS